MSAFLKSLDDMKIQAKATGKRFASGSATSYNAFSVSGLAFTPSLVMIADQGDSSAGMYCSLIPEFPAVMGAFSALRCSISIVANGFNASTDYYGRVYKWYAIE